MGHRLFNIKEDAKWIDSTALVMQVGLTMAGSILFCLAIGYYLDKWLNLKGVFTVIFILLGVAGGSVTVYRQIMKSTEEDQKKGGKDGKST